MAFDKLLETFGRAFIPKNFRDPLLRYLLKAGYDRVPYALYGMLFFIAVIIIGSVFLVYINPLIAQKYAPLVQFVIILVFWSIGLGAMCVLFMFFIWSYLNLVIYRRTKEMEDKLPDYLRLVVTNLRSGMSFDRSLWGAIRPEFGVLAREITIVSKKVMTGNDTMDALFEFSTRYDSPILRRSVNLIVSELRAGGEIAAVIERVIENLQKTKQLKEEMAASVVSYMIFISVIVLFLAPVLFALANTILNVVLSLADQIAGGPSSGGGGAAAALFSKLEALAAVKDQLLEDFRRFSFLAIGVIALFAGIIVSIIEKGDVRGGIKYIPVFITVSTVLFWLSISLLNSLFGSLF